VAAFAGDGSVDFGGAFANQTPYRDHPSNGHV